MLMKKSIYQKPEYELMEELDFTVLCASPDDDDAQGTGQDFEWDI